MESEEVSRIRHYLGKSQSQMAKLLCVSPKAIQSFEQGWRNVPASVERYLLFLITLKAPPDENPRSCWEIRRCPGEWKAKCAAWEFRAGGWCWFVNGTFCDGQNQANWKRKIAICRQCEVFQPSRLGLGGQSLNL
ncbi:MAG: helix-turn-helix transcriptional regulator [Chloroflexi bacterium]|nr:helix-turn-helix transcriptional regulator [Chloroflexota bacterium]